MLLELAWGHNENEWEVVWNVGDNTGEHEHDFMIMREDGHIDVSFASKAL